VEQWRALGLAALVATGQSPAYIGALLHQMDTESSGNPNAINLTDINAQRGDPSIGLMQVIHSTFVRALTGTRFEGLIAKGQYDPWANIIASILYASGPTGPYHSLARAYRGVAYDQGGVWPSGTAGVNTSGHDELVLTGPQARALGGVTVATGAIQITVNGNADTVALRRELEVALRRVLSDDLNRRL
jgi:SLT domain-containing protein